MSDISTYISYVEQEISRVNFPSAPENLYNPLRYFLQLGGKRMRPVLTLLAAELFGTNKEQALHAALAVEVFHNFTLIHDDIMDNAPLRRNHQTVHTKWNSNIAILSGDVLFVKAYELLAQQKPEHLPDLLKLFSKTAAEVCEGQQFDMDFEARNNVTIPEYIEMIRLKTSVLLGCALELGAITANASEENRKHCYDFGQFIGLAFQIQDDILDLYADPEKFGKQVGGDVIANKKTLLNLKAFELASAEQREMLIQLSNEQQLDKKVAETRLLYDQLGVRKACELIQQEYYELAIAALSKINTDPDKKQPLLNLANFLIKRNN